MGTGRSRRRTTWLDRRCGSPSAQPHPSPAARRRAQPAATFEVTLMRECAEMRSVGQQYFGLANIFDVEEGRRVVAHSSSVVIFSVPVKQFIEVVDRTVCPSLCVAVVWCVLLYVSVHGIYLSCVYTVPLAAPSPHVAPPTSDARR